MKHRTIRLLAVATLFGVTGCEVGPNYEPPKVTVLSDWGEQGREPTTRSDARLATTQPSRTLSGRPPVVAWWTTFNDEELDSLIARAVDANLDLKRAESVVREARAQRASIGSALFPSVNTSGSYEHVRASKNGVISAFGGGSSSSSSSSSSSGSSSGSSGGVSVGGIGAQAPGAGGSSATPGGSLGEFDLYQAGFDASWEIDVFGRTRRAVEGADALTQASVEGERDVLLTVMGEVAREYCDLRSLQRRVQIARDNLALQQETLALIDELVAHGVTSPFDQARARAEVATTEASVPPLVIEVGRSIHRLSVLLAERPTALAAELEISQPLPPVPDAVPVGLPSDLLRRRPDIRRAERQLAASAASVGVATADLFPRFSLNGSLGTQSIEPGHLADFASRYFSIGPSISYPLFDGGRTRAQLRVAQAQREQSVYAFQQTVLSALREVEDALIAYQRQQDRTQSLRVAVEANQQSVRIAQDLYKQGLEDFLSVVDAERTLYVADDALATSEGEQATSLVALYKSLGGGWENREMFDIYGPQTPRPIVTSGSDQPDGLIIAPTAQ